MTRLICGAVLLVSLMGCGRLGIVDPGGDVLLRSGTSFGMCSGYCIFELVVRDGSATYTRTSRTPSQYPRMTQTVSLSEAEFESLRTAASSPSFRELQSVYGCPDCADGGAEWLAIDGWVVTLEYGADLEPIRPLLHEVRALRARFEPQRWN
ncbi:MAG: hypothetical protein H0U67_01530 [Gemmatimonadetes bacterium]|nr:hypothetical protein [Gemmatimonadota bacterium]